MAECETGDSHCFPGIQCDACDMVFEFALVASSSKSKETSWECMPCIKKSKQEDPTNLSKDLRSDVKGVKKDLLTSELPPKKKKVIEKKMTMIERSLTRVEKITVRTKEEIKRMQNLEERTLAIEQQGRVRNLLLRGITEYPSEDDTEIITRAVSLLGYPITTEHFTYAGRLEKVKTDANSTPRTVLLKFHDLFLKNRVLWAFKMRKGVKMQEIGYKGDTNTILAYEDLTKYTKDLFRMAVTYGNFYSVSTYDGQVFVRKDKTSEKIILKSGNHLCEFLDPEALKLKLIMDEEEE